MLTHDFGVLLTRREFSLSESMFSFIRRSCVATAFTMLGVLPERAELLTRVPVRDRVPISMATVPMPAPGRIMHHDVSCTQWVSHHTMH